MCLHGRNVAYFEFDTLDLSNYFDIFKRQGVCMTVMHVECF